MTDVRLRGNKTTEWGFAGSTVVKESNMTKFIKLKPNAIKLLFFAIFFVCLVTLYIWRGQPAKETYASDFVSMRSLLVASIEIARRGGQKVKEVREKADIGERSKGGVKNPVTEGDMESHKQMYFGFLKAFPNVRVVSEEGQHDDKSIQEGIGLVASMPQRNDEVFEIIEDEADAYVPAEDVDVWIDPLDATQEYTEHLLEYVTTMACVAVKGRPVLGVVYKPFSDEMAWAWSGPNFMSRVLAKDVAKASEEAKEHPMQRSSARIVVSRSHAGKVHDVAEAGLGPGVIITPAGGAGFKVWEVLKGNQDAYVHASLIKKWDICAGSALMSAAGGKLTALDGSEIDYSSHPLDEAHRGGVLAAVYDHPLLVDKFKDARTI